MFRMLVFLIAAPLLWHMVLLGFVYVSAGNLPEALPFFAAVLMGCSYFVKGAAETFSYLKAFLK